LTFGLQHGPVARIVKGARIRLIDKNGADVADGEAGELLVRGANVFAVTGMILRRRRRA